MLTWTIWFEFTIVIGVVFLLVKWGCFTRHFDYLIVHHFE
jgi:hypothetical protein